VTSTPTLESPNLLRGPSMRPLHLRPLTEILTIQKKDLKVEPIDFADPFTWAQVALLDEIERQYNLGLPVRIIVLKGRQLGVSTGTEATLFNWTFIHPGTRSLVIAHETKAAQHLFDMTKLMWEEWPFNALYTEKHNTVKSLSWVETRSSMSVATAKNAGSGRSFTYHAVHCSECAFWDEPERLMVGLNQSVPFKHGTIVILESTANGVGNWFHEEWQRAVHGQSQYVPLFFPWFMHEEYQFANTTLRYRDLDRDERELHDEGIYLNGITYKITLPQLAWRRHTIDNDCLGDVNDFHQEYPCTPNEAFLSTGRNVFPLNKLDEHTVPERGVRGMLINDNGRITFTRDASGPLTIYKGPGRDPLLSKYVVGGDPTKTTYGDAACIQVLNRFTFEQVAVFHQHLDAVPFAHELMKLGFFYNTALLNCEIEGPGYATIGVVLDNGYPDVWQHRWSDKAPGKVSQSYGWSTNYQRKHWAIEKVKFLLAQRGGLQIHDQLTHDQMEHFVYLGNGEMGAASDRLNDDAVMALAIAIVSTLTEVQLPHEEGPEASVHDLFGEPPWEAA
jgi:hypothetical protein